ncbi:22298_t:CDS:2, partial [Dentiscutata erythropus]
MTRLAEYKRHLRSNTFDIEKATIAFLEGHVKYLQRRFKRKEIKIKELESRLKDLDKLKEDVIKLKNQIDSLLNENEALRHKSNDLSSVIDYRFKLMAYSVENAELTIFFQKMKKLFKTYQNKYEIDFGSLRITEIIDNVKWKELILTDVILAEICSYLTPKDLFSLKQVAKFLFEKLQVEYFWKKSRQQQPNYNHKCPIHMTEQQYCYLNFMYQRCQFCKRSDFSLILELKTKICSECREQVLISRFEIEEENLIPFELLLAFHSVDDAQLDGRYLDYSVREFSVSSSLVYYLKSEVYDTFDEYLKIPQNEKQEWLNNKSKII